MLFTLLSALLLILSFPKFSFWPLAWFSFVPVFYALRRKKTYGDSFIHFYFFGFLFFFASVEWLRHVSYFGWIFVATAYSLYFGLFGLAVHWLWRRKRFFLSLFVLPSLWCILEWLRSEIPVWGFGWNLLAYTQSFNLDIASIASFIGAYGLSWIIVFANLAIFFVLDFELNHKKSEGVIALVGVLSLALIFGVYFAYVGLSSKISAPRGGNVETLKTAVIQGNIPQNEKWDPKYKFQILETHEKLTELITSQTQDVLDLIIWPEAAYPGFYNVDPERDRMLSLVRRVKAPILFGGLHVQRTDSGSEHYFNSAYLIDPDTGMEDRYDKVRLVSFGEYVPWHTFFNWFGLERLAYSLGVSDFTAGNEMKVFSLDLPVIVSEAKQSRSEIASGATRPRNDGSSKKFAALICFEDTFPNLARQAVHNGAQFLVVITNDAWFSKSAAPYQHLQASIFRAIENGVPVIRAANTGISAIITRQGVILDRVKDSKGHDSFIAGGILSSISLADEKTFYQSKGHLIPYLCLIFVITGFILSLAVKK